MAWAKVEQDVSNLHNKYVIEERPNFCDIRRHAGMPAGETLFHNPLRLAPVVCALGEH